MNHTGQINPITPAIHERLTAAGWHITGANTRVDSHRGHTMSEVFIEKEGIKLELVSQLWEDDDIRGFKGYTTNGLDDDCEFFNDLESVNIISHEGALLGLIHQLP